MATYAIGDLQGCYDPLLSLLDHINYDPKNDALWFTGDIVNRGPKSLACLRFVANQPNCQIVLGNHDLHCLVAYYGYQPLHPSDTLSDIFNAHDAQILMQWLIQQPLLHYDPDLSYCLVHAGILPSWDFSQAKQYALEAETELQTNTQHFLHNLYGHEPDTWDPDLTGMDRYRFIVNAFTRMRYCLTPMQLEFATKSPPHTVAKPLIPWFEIPARKAIEQTIIFGHWASLACQVKQPGVFALDSGCVWGGSLTALRLEDQQRFSVK